jgi:hypothetical protein
MALTLTFTQPSDAPHSDPPTTLTSPPPTHTLVVQELLKQVNSMLADVGLPPSSTPSPAAAPQPLAYTQYDTQYNQRYRCADVQPERQTLEQLLGRSLSTCASPAAYSAYSSWGGSA